LRPRFSSAESLPGTRTLVGRPSRKRIGAAAATLAAIAGVAGGAVASPARALAADTSPTAPVRVQATAFRSSTPPLSGVLSGQPGGSPLARPVSQAVPSPLAAPSGQPGPSPLAVTPPVTGASPLAAQPAAPVPHATPAQPATPAPSPSATASTAANSSNGQSGPQQPPTPRRFTFYDSVTPSAIPRGQIAATYATGPFAVQRSQVAGRPQVLWIDTNGSDPRADVLDVEPGDATPSEAATWAYQKLKAEPGSLACIYTMLSQWQATQAAINTLPSWMHSHIRWWIADPTGHRHIVPGADATQWYWGNSYDISTAKSSL